MLEYKVYTINELGAVLQRVEIVCKDDAAAFAHAQAYAGRRGVEIWEHDRLVARIPIAQGLKRMRARLRMPEAQ